MMTNYLKLLSIIVLALFLFSCQKEIPNIEIIFDTQGGTSISPITYQLGDPIFDIPTTEKEGHTFIGWFLEDDLPFENFDFTTFSNDSITLVAKWEINTYSIRLNLDSDLSETLEFSYQSEIILENPQKLHHRFLGWFTDELTSVPFTESKMPAHDLFIYAKWEVLVYPISYVLNQGTNHVDNPDSYTYLSSLSLYAIEREGYTFQGFYDNPTFEGDKIDSIENRQEPSLTLYAKWELNSYQIIFDTVLGLPIDDLVIYYGAKIDLPVASKPEMIFSGWYLDEMYEKPFDLITMPSKDITVYAKWQTELTYDTQGGSLIASLLGDPGSSINEVKPTKEGMTFTGWFMDLDYSTPFVFDVMPNKNTTIYARWQNSIFFDTQGGSILPTITGDAGTPVTKPEQPTKIGHTFVGWFNDSTFLSPYTFQTIPAINQTVYVQWRANPYSMIFNENGGSNVTDYVNVNYGTAITYPIPSRRGYDFYGWYLDNQTFKKPYSTPYMEDKNITLYAKWELSKYQITYHMDGGTNPESNLYEFTIQTRLTLQAPTRVGYRFLGWFTNSDFSGVAVSQISGQYTDHLTLYAKFEINNYTMSFNSNGGTAISSITRPYQSLITPPTPPTRVGHTFLGWFKDSALTESYMISTMPAEAIMLYAKWQVNTYTMTFNSNGGSPVSPQTANYGSVLVQPSVPVREGYIFRGWYQDTTLLNPYSITTMPGENLTLYAKWSSGSDDYEENTFYFDLVSKQTNIIKIILYLDGKVSLAGYDLEILYPSNHLRLVSSKALLSQTINAQVLGKIKSIYVDALNPLFEKTALIELEFELLSSLSTEITIQINEAIDVNSNYEIIITDYHTIAYIVNE